MTNLFGVMRSGHSTSGELPVLNDCRSKSASVARGTLVRDNYGLRTTTGSKARTVDLKGYWSDAEDS